MTSLTSIASTISAAFLGSLVEVVEAFTIILAVGVTQSWKPAFIGSGAALVVLGLLTITLGPLLGLIPIEALQFTIGTLLILFGLRWLRKAILRASGYIARHDEEKAFAKESESLRRHSADQRANLLAGIAAFKAVLLEGIEVVFIVIATGAGQGMMGYASIGAAAACILVLIVGLFVHKPLSSVPENSLKFVVGLLISAFGIFWTGEGIGARWPGADLSLIPIFAALAAFSWLAVKGLRQHRIADERAVR
ncbi:COG4280 domain-containing protein [Rhizobium sp. Rhizsp82]|uniref:COG4280 domain-containing protein n=1 Tax=Rhizobium sp. Rhizsp82 TaxID=3243057 RepID=UPI0039B69624